MQSNPPLSGQISMPAMEFKNESTDFSQVMFAEP